MALRQRSARKRELHYTLTYTPMEETYRRQETSQTRNCLIFQEKSPKLVQSIMGATQIRRSNNIVIQLALIDHSRSNKVGFYICSAFFTAL